MVRSTTVLSPRPLQAGVVASSEEQVRLRMSGGKGRGKQPRDTAADDALVVRPGATDPLLAAREGATDAQIADSLQQGLPHLTDPASLQDQSFGKQPQGIGIQAEQGKEYFEQKKRTRTTSQATQTQPLLLAADNPFAAALEAIPAEDWCRTWAACRTIMLGRTSKRVKRDSGQDAPACRCPVEQQLLGRRSPQSLGRCP
jgi:hypothetical protein